MKNYIFYFGILFILSGCGQSEVVLRLEDMEKSDSQAVEKVLDENVEETVSDAAQGEDLGRGVELAIAEDFISWGHKKSSRRNIDTIIVHSVYNPFSDEPHELADVLDIFRDYGVAPHYIIERDGTVHYIVTEKDIAWHAGRSRVPDGRTNVNDFSIGIEMINSLNDTYTDAQYAVLRALVLDIKKRHNIKYVLGHDEIEVEDPWNFDWERINNLRHEAR